MANQLGSQGKTSSPARLKGLCERPTVPPLRKRIERFDACAAELRRSSQPIGEEGGTLSAAGVGGDGEEVTGVSGSGSAARTVPIRAFDYAAFYPGQRKPA